MFPIIAKLQEGTAVVFKRNDPVFILENLHGEIDIYAETHDCLCFLESLSLDPCEFKDKRVWDINYIKIYEHNEYTVYWMEA